MQHQTFHKELEKLTAEELAGRAQEGSEAYFTEIVKRFGPRLFHFFRPRVDSVPDAEDLVQDTLVKAFQNLSRYNPKYAFSTWLFTIGRRLAVSYYRKAQSERSASPVPLRQTAADPGEILLHIEERTNLWLLAQKLPGRQYDVLWLRYVEEMPIKDIAKVLQLTRVHVKVLLFRAREGLQKLHRRAEASTVSVEETGRTQITVSGGKGNRQGRYRAFRAVSTCRTGRPI